ncbi:hypothetical protein [Teredinibacter sp. KSP-S5-2]|uniref:hypothetical protein n=1 Tax=Teredinibacter sp. KSP-S5-2 TaxID=3034506 RepID=UPI0029342F38|nr:hypothetical protein [Teredinibacter sp. KSP-S5-2]WNO11134.1 hypothetical protein P5V12_08110 [Teredinibacter sp. KSP-S5-2]
MKDSYYVIAEIDKRRPNESNSSTWPKLVAYSPKWKKLYIEEGYGHGLMGGTISLSNFNVSDWLITFEESGCEWFGRCISNGTLEKIQTEKELEKELIANGCEIKKIIK